MVRGGSHSAKGKERYVIMKKTFKKLCAVALAGMFSLQSVSLMTLSSSAAEEASEGIAKATATVDGIKDEAYADTCTVNGNTTEINFLWDDSYYYVYATIEDSTANDGDMLYLAFMNKDNNFWNEACVLEFHLNKDFARMEIEFGSAYEGCGGNFARMNSTENTASTEYAIKKTDSGYVVEARIADNALAVGKGMAFGYGVKNDGAWCDGLGDDAGTTWQKVYNGDQANIKDGPGTIITCAKGNDAPVIPTDGNIVKKGTPRLDGKLDSIYSDSYKLDTLDLLKAGDLSIAWPNSTPTLNEYLDSGLLADENSTKLLAPETIPDVLVHAEMYFLWDDDALYIFTKVYDNDIHDLLAETDYTYDGLAENIVHDRPWLNESVTHTIYPVQNHFIDMAVTGIASGAMYDAGACSKPETWGTYDACINFDGWSKLHCWHHVDEATKNEDRANLASAFHEDEGYYTVEMRIPISERDLGGTPLKDAFLKSGEKFDYLYTIWDVRGLASGKNFNNYNANAWIGQMLDKDKFVTMTLSGEEAVPAACEHEWDADYTVDKAATCTEEGQKSIYCSLCGEYKPDSTVTIPALGHDYVDGFCTRCGEAETLVAKKYTPVLDGVLDDAYLDSASFKASDLGKHGKLSLGWSNWANGVDELVEAGLLKDKESTALLPDGDYTTPAFTDAEVYFLWDDDALYVYTKVYDNDPIDITSSPFFKEEGRTVYGSIGVDRPWINDTVSHIINPLANPYATINATGDAFGHYAWDSANGGWSDLCYFEGSDAATREASAANVKATVIEGGYAVELRIPISEKSFGGPTLKDAFLKDGSNLTYKYQLIDTVSKLVGSPFSDNGYQCSDWLLVTSSALNIELSGEAPHIHTWAEDYTVDTAATCTEAGSKSIHCTECDAVKPDSTVVIEALGHDWSEEYTVDTAATCTAEGSKSIHCKRCDEKKPESDVAVPKIAHTFKDGKCEVCGYVYGDVTGDGKLDTKDLVRLMKYIAAKGEGVEGVEPDINGDGNVDTKDLIRLMKVLSGDKSVIPAAPEASTDSAQA